MIEKIYDLKEKLNKKIIFIIPTALIIIVVGLILFNSNNNDNKDTSNDLVINDKKEIKEEKENCTVRVDVKGYVNNPNLYEVDCNLRINDIINIAGGLKEEADTSVINLSKKVFDEMVLVIYSKDEVKDFTKVKEEEKIKDTKCKTESVITNDGCINKENRVETNIKEKEETNKLVSINTATKEELMTLTGIGESKALDIITYRETNGQFEKIEDLLNISGIGEKMFEKIKDSITL